MRHDSCICDMTHAYVTRLMHMWHDSFTCGMTHSCVTCLSIRDMTHLYVMWLIHMWHDSFTCDTTYSHVTEAWSGCLQEEGGASSYCLTLPFTQFWEGKFKFFLLPVNTGWLSRASLYPTFPVNRPHMYQAVGAASKDIERHCMRHCLRSIPSQHIKSNAGPHQRYRRISSRDLEISSPIPWFAISVEHLWFPVIFKFNEFAVVWCGSHGLV